MQVKTKQGWTGSREEQGEGSLSLGNNLGVVKRRGPQQSQPSMKKEKCSPFKYFKVLLCCSTALTQTYPCNPIYLVYPQEPEAHNNFLKVCAVSQVALITNHMPELLPLQSQTGFELDLLHCSHCILDQPVETSPCRACGTHQGSLSMHSFALTSCLLGLNRVLEL